MNIQSVSCNYTNQKFQKNNSKLAFGMAQTKAMEAFLAPHLDQMYTNLEVAVRKPLAEKLMTMLGHSLYVDAASGKFRILSPDGTHFHPVEPGKTFGASLDNILAGLSEHDSLLGQGAEKQGDFFSESI